jgi:hypothetical protein
VTLLEIFVFFFEKSFMLSTREKGNFTFLLPIVFSAGDSIVGLV